MENFIERFLGINMKVDYITHYNPITLLETSLIPQTSPLTAIAIFLPL